MAERIFRAGALTACDLSRQNYDREREEESSMADIRIVASGLGFPEGPVAMADGSVILGEISGRKVTRVAPDGSKTEIGKAGGGPNGLALGPHRARYGCNNGGAVCAPTPD